ncbi:MAG: methyltransferase [Candidatus Kerfeldbacteria bacterium]|nr:methyltransferase [Candidatus Kerfeldbacteria bacterium]
MTIGSNNNAVAAKRDIEFRVTLRGHALVLHSTWGLFSPDEVDDGTRLLAEQVTMQPDDTILDLGCGYGVPGVALAKDAPQGTVHLVDKDFVAVEYTEKNLKANGITNARAYLSNGFSHVPSDVRFTLIVANLSAKVGNELLSIFVHDARGHLGPGGRFVVVTIAGLKEHIKRQFNEIFGNYRKVKQSGTYVVAETRR